MDPKNPPAAVLVLVPVTLVVALYVRFKPRRGPPLPPGPKGNWFFGNMLDIAKSPGSWIKLAEYTEQYGPLVTIRLLTQRMFVVSDPELVTELFEKRAANYSDRSRSEMLKLTGWHKDLVVMEPGPRHKRHRAMINRAVNNRKAKDYIPLVQQEVRRFMKYILDTPEDFYTHVHLLASSLTLRMVYGYTIQSANDEFVQIAETTTHGYADMASPWRWSVNVFPALRHLPEWLPLAPFQRRAIYLRKKLNELREKPFAFVSSQIAAGTAEDSYVAKLLQPDDGSIVDEQAIVDIKSTAATLYVTGSDTSVSSIQSFFLAMTLYPEVQARAQAEIAGYRRDHNSNAMILPVDQPSLPYTNALVRELLRWHPVVHNIGHRSGDKDDNNVVVRGRVYRIPARSLVIANAWQIMHDPKVYTDPERFAPERFLGPNPPPDPESYAFGFGKRSCLGLHIAQQSLWITISNMLLNFTVSKRKDEDGNDIVPEERYTEGIISHPYPFVCSITPREGCKEWLREIA